MIERYSLRVVCLSALLGLTLASASAQQFVLASHDATVQAPFLVVDDGIPVASAAAAIDAELPPDGVLTPAHPNPFNPRTSVTLTLDAQERVVVAVYNMLGRPVDVLFEGVLPAATPTTFSFDAGALPSGLYLFHVQGESFVATRQALLLK